MYPTTYIYSVHPKLVPSVHNCTIWWR